MHFPVRVVDAIVDSGAGRKRNLLFTFGFFLVVCLLWVWIMFCPTVTSQEAGPLQGESPLAGASYVENQLIIKFVEGIPDTEKKEVRSSLSFVTLRELSLIRAELVQVSGMTVEEAIDLLKGDPRIEYAEPNYVWHADIIPDDPDFDLLWGLHNTGQTGGTPDADIDAVDAWNIDTGNSIIIGVIDTGVDTAHVDLLGNIWTNPGEIPDNGMDDDSNGYVDDMHGWDFVNWDNGPIDDNGHGTHCSGTIAAVGNNAVGVVGVCWSAKIMALKFLDQGGYGSTSDAVLAVEYATMMGANLTSNSWGGGGVSQALVDAIIASNAHGMLFVAAAGNSGVDNDVYPHYPSSYGLDNIIAVAATDHNDQLADEPTWGSNWGLNSVDLGAPGVSIYSTTPGGGYGYKSGTSMATPHVSGAAALIWSTFPTDTHLEVKDRMMLFVDPLPGLAGKCVTGGRLNVFLAMAEPDSTPPAPISDLGIIKTEATRVTLSWTAPGDDSATGTAAYYDARYSASPIYEGNFYYAAEAYGEPEPQTAGSPETFVVTGLGFNTNYYFAVKAFDEWNNPSDLSNTPSVVTLGPPDIQVTPASLSDSLYTNGFSSQSLNIANLEEGELFYEIDVEYPTATRVSETIAIPPPAAEVSGEAALGHEPRSFTEEIQFDISGELVTGTTRDVLLIYADNGASALKAILEGYADIDVVDVWYAGAAGGSIPSLSDLEGYDVVVAWNNQAWQDMYAIGDLLADYIDDGGAVVTTVDCWSAGTFASHGRYFDESGYSPFQSLGGALFSSRTLGWYDPFHPIMDGVTSLSLTRFYNNVAFTNVAVRVAEWDDGTPLVGTNPQTVAINVWPGDGYYWSGDFPTLIHNAINYVTGAFWLWVLPDSGEVAPYSDSTLDVNFDAENLLGGDHQAAIVIKNNDPDESVVLVEAYLHVIDSQDLKVDSDTIDFGVVYIGYPESLPLLVSNQGTATLTVTDVSTDLAQFSVDVISFTLASDQDTAIKVTFAPTDAGELWSNLTISSDDPDEPVVTVVLRGEGLICPDIWADADSISDSLLTGAISTQMLTVGNSGGSPLYLEVELDNFVEPSPPLSHGGVSIQQLLGTRGEKSSSYDPDARTVRGLYESGQDGFSVISAEPGDVLASWPAPSPISGAWGLGFDGRDVWVSDIAYTGLTDNEVSTAGALLSWFSCSGWVGAWPADMAWDGHCIWQVNVGGDNGIYQLDPTDGTVLSSIHDPSHTWDAISQRGLAYDKREDVFYVGGWNQDMVYTIKGLSWDNPGEIMNSFYFPNVSGLAWHPRGTLWIAVNAGTDYIFQVDPETGAVISQFLAPGAGMGYEGAGLAVDRAGNLWCVSQTTQMVYLVESGVPAYNWVEVTPEVCTLGIGETKELEVKFDAADLFGGDYSADIIIHSNDCDQPSLTVAALLSVTGAPDIAVDPDSLDYGIVFIGASVTDIVTISNQGSDSLTVSDISSDNSDYTVDTTSFSLAPGQSQALSVTFAPSVSATITATLTITSDDPDEPNVMVSLQGEGAEPPDILVSPGSLSDSLFTGDTSAHVLTIYNAGASDLVFDISIEQAEAGSISVNMGLSSDVQRKSIRIEEVISSIIDRSGILEGPISIESEPWMQTGSTTESANVTYVEADQIAQAKFNYSSRGELNVAVLGSPGSATWNYDVQSKLLGTGFFSSVSVINIAVVTPTLGELQAFDAVLVYSDGPRFENSQLLGNVLADYVDLGGGVVCAVFATASIPFAGRFDEENYWAISPSGQTQGTRQYLGTIYDFGHPILEGVVSFDGGSASYRQSSYDIAVGATRIVDWTDGRALVAAKIIQGTNRADLGFFPPSSDARSDFWEAGTHGDLLMANALVWVGGAAKWVTADPTSGMLPSGDSIDIDVIFDATDLTGGDYDADIVISSNDPDEAVVVIPAYLHVIGVPDIAVDPDSVDFGVVGIGYPKSLPLLVSNPGTDTLTVTNVATGLAEFSVDAISFALGPDCDTTVNVTFAPTVTAQVWDTVSISSDDPDEPLYEVLLVGSGRECPDLALNPAILGDSLLIGEVSVDSFFLKNVGLDSLEFSFPYFAGALLNGPADLGTGGPDSSGYTWIDSDQPGGPFFSFIDISSTGTLVTGLGDANHAGPFPIGFSFPFYGGFRTQFYVHSDGVVKFDDAWISSTNRSIPEADRYNNLIAWCWDDFNGTTGEVYYQQMGNRLIVQFVDYPQNQTSGTVDAEVILYSTGNIVFQYDNFKNGFDQSSNTVGIENADGTDGLQVAYNTNYLHDDMAILFSRRSELVDGISPVSGKIASGDSVVIEVSYSAEYLAGGDYVDSLQILSNDCGDPDTLIPLYLHVTGIQDIAVTDTVDFGPVFTVASLTESLIVYNEGTDLLTVTNLSCDNSDYNLDTSSFSLNPWQMRKVPVTFTPSVEGVILGTVAIQSNDPDEPTVTVMLRGQGLIPPDISVIQDSLVEDLQTGETSSQILTIDNTGGGSELIFDIYVGQAEPTAAVESLNRRFDPQQKDTGQGESVSGEVTVEYQPNTVARLYSAPTSSGIGNIVILGPDADWEEPYLSNVAQYLIESGRFSSVTTINGFSVTPTLTELQTYDAVGVFGWYGWYDQYTIGDVLADYVDAGGNVFIAFAANVSSGAWKVRGRFDAEDYWLISPYYYEGGLTWAMGTVHQPGHPIMAGVDSLISGSKLQVGASVSAEAILLAEFQDGTPLAAVNKAGISRRVDISFPFFTNAVTYWGIDPGTDATLLITNAFEWLIRGGWLRVEPASDTVAAGNSKDVTVIFDAAGMNGDYQATILVLSNDPDEPTVAVPARLHVTAAPDISVSEDTLRYGNVFVASSDTDTLMVYNLGIDSLTVTDMSCDNSDYELGLSSFILGPALGQEVPIIYTPSTPGPDTATLTIVSDDPDEPIVTVLLVGEGIVPPSMSVLQDLLSEVLLIGEISVQFLTISNGGVADLIFDISVEKAAATAVPVRPSLNASEDRPGLVALGKPLGPTQGWGEWLYRSETGVPLRTNDGSGSTELAYPRAYRWQPEQSSAQASILVYADDFVHAAPNTFVDQALQYLRLPYIAHYEGDWAGFETNLSTGTWDLVMFADEYWFPPITTLTALDNYMISGGHLVFQGWTVGSYPTHSLWTTLGLSWSEDDLDPPDPVYWWEPENPVFNNPKAVPEFLSLDGGIYGVYGQKVQPLAGFEALAGYTVPGPDSNQAVMIRGNDGRTVFKGFLDGQNSANLDQDAMLDGVELWVNLVENTGEIRWLSVDPTCDTIPGQSSMDIAVRFDATQILVGDHSAYLNVVSNDPDGGQVAVPVQLRAVERGDVNGDFNVGIADIVFLLNYVFRSGPSPAAIEAGDLNCDGAVNVIDVVYLLNYLFTGGPAPCS